MATESDNLGTELAIGRKYAAELLEYWQATNFQMRAIFLITNTFDCTNGLVMEVIPVPDLRDIPAFRLPIPVF